MFAIEALMIIYLLCFQSCFVAFCCKARHAGSTAYAQDGIAGARRANGVILWSECIHFRLATAEL